MSDNNKLPKQAKPQEFELVELLFREYISSHIARPDIEYSFQARFQSFIDQIPSYLHSVSKTGFFTHFFFGSFASLLDTQLADKLVLKKLHFNFDSADHLRIVAETNDKTHVFIFTENNKNKKQNKNKDIGFTKDEWKKITGREYTDDDNKKLEINIININKSTGSINVAVEQQDIQDGASSTKQYHEITKQFVDKDGKYIALEDKLKKLSDLDVQNIEQPLRSIFEYTKKIHDHYQGLPYGDKAQEADEHGFVAGIFNNFRYRENAHVYLEQFAGKGYADIVLLVRGADRSPKSIPIIIELKAGIGPSTNSDDALKQVEEYTKGFQPNNMRILSLSDHVLCVGMNLDSPSDSFMQMQVVERNQEVVPVIQQIVNQLVTEDILNHHPTPDDLIVIKHIIQQSLEKTYNTFPGTGEKSSAHYMSRFLLGESLVLKDYDKHIFIYDKASYIPTATVIDDHGTRSKKPKIEKIVDGSNAVNSILFIPTSSADSPAILVNIIDVNRDVVVNNIRLDNGLIGNRKIVQLNIQFNIDKYKESFEEYCKINLLKIYGSISEYNQASVEVKGQLYFVDEELSDNLSEHLQQAISSQEGLVISESRYKELMGKIGEIVYPIKSLIGRESEFQGLLEGIFKYYSDVSLSEGAERRALVLMEFQTGAGGRIDMLVQAIGPLTQGSKEYIPVGLELKYDDSIYLRSSDKSKSEEEQEVLLNDKAKHVVEKLLQDQTERYSKGAAIKSITDGNKVAIMGIVFNAQSIVPNKLFLTTDKFLAADIVHSSKVYSISIGAEFLDIMDDNAWLDNVRFIPDWYKITLSNHISNDQIIDLSNKGIGDQITLKSLLLNHALQKIDSLDLSYNKLTADDLKGLSTMFQQLRLVNLDFSDNDLANDVEDLKQLIGNSGAETLKIHDIGVDDEQLASILRYLKGNSNLINLDIADLDTASASMSHDTAAKLQEYLEDNTTLESLSLINTKIDDYAAVSLARALYKNTVLSTLILTNNLIGKVGANNLAFALQHSNIVKLDLSGNNIGVAGVEDLARAINNNRGIKEITLVNVGLQYDAQNSNDAMLEAMYWLFQNPRLYKIDLSENNVGNGALQRIFSTLKDNIERSQLEVLSLAGNKLDVGFTDLSMWVIAGLIKDYISATKALRSLDLSSMDITDAIGEEIVKGLEGNSGLVSLDLSGNANGDVKISTKTLLQLAKVLPNDQYLKYLNLADNHLSVRDLNTLIGGIKENKVLSHLNLSGNDFTTHTMIDEHGGLHLDIQSGCIDFKGLLQDTGLKYLNLANSQLSQASISLLFEGLENNDILEILDISGNRIESSSIDSIVSSLLQNANQGLNGLKILHLNQYQLDDAALSKLAAQTKSLGIKVFVDDAELSNVILPSKQVDKRMVDAIEGHDIVSSDDGVEESKLTTKVLEDSNHHKHRHHHGEWHERAKHQIDKSHTEDHQRERRDLADTLKNNGNKQLHDKLVSDQEQHVRSDTDSRYDAIVRVQHVIMGRQHRIEQDASKFIDSKASPIDNSVNNQWGIDWQGNLLLGRLLFGLFGKKCSGEKCKVIQDVANDHVESEYAHRLAYSSYAPVIERNIEDTELVGEV